MHTAPIHYSVDLGELRQDNGRRFRVALALNIETKAQLRAAGRLAHKAAANPSGITRLQFGLVEFHTIEITG